MATLSIVSKATQCLKSLCYEYNIDTYVKTNQSNPQQSTTLVFVFVVIMNRMKYVYT